MTWLTKSEEAARNRVHNTMSEGTYTQTYDCWVHEFKDYEAAGLLQKMRFKEQCHADKNNGWFYITETEVKDTMYLTPDRRRSIIKMLCKKGLINTRRYGLPARQWIRFNWNEMDKVLSADTWRQKVIVDQGNKSPGNPITSHQETQEHIINTYNKNKIKTSSKEDVRFSDENRRTSSALQSIAGAGNVKRKKRRKIATSAQKQKIPRRSVPSPTRKDCLPYEAATPAAQSILDFWNSLEHTPTHRKDGKGVMQALKHLDDTVLADGIRAKHVRKAMEDWDGMCTAPSRFKIGGSGKRTSLLEFLKGSRYGGNNGNGTDPWLPRLLEPGAVKRFTRRQDRHPEITERFRHEYCNRVLKEDPDTKVYTPGQEADFVDAAAKLHKYMEGKRLERYIDKVDYKDYVMFTLRALNDRWGIGKFGSGSLRSDYTYSELVPNYITAKFKS